MADWMKEPPRKEELSSSGGSWMDAPPSDDEIRGHSTLEPEKAWHDISAKGLARGAIDAIPVIGAIGGGVMGGAAGSVVPGPGTAAGAVGGAGLGYAGGKELADILKNRLLGDQATSTEPIEQVKRVGSNVKDGMMMEMGGQTLGAGLSAANKARLYMQEKAGKGLKSFAEKSAVNATGATGRQASEFADDAGRELLDRKIVRFGDSQEKIAERAGEAVKQAYGQIDDALAKLEAGGVKVDANKIYEVTSQKIKQLKSDPSQADVVRLLEKELDNLIGATEAKGSTSFGIKEAEQIKRGYNRKAGNWMDPEKGMVGKDMYQTFRGGVEDAAQAADPATAKMFEEGKKTYGLLAPIREAAERRAATTAQSPAGGFLDVTTAVAGGVSGGLAPAIAAPIARRMISPRISSSVAVGSDKVAQYLLKQPRFAKLAQTNPRAFSALVADFSKRTGAEAPKAADFDPQKPGDDQQAREAFLDQ